MKSSKRVLNNKKIIDKNKDYPLLDAISILKKSEQVKFDETVEVHVNLGVDPRHADQNLRGTVSYPHGTGKSIKVLVMTKTKVDEAKEAGADYVGLDEYVEKIQGGWADIDVIITTPDAMGSVGKLGRILGPKGLMPNPKSGTVTMDVANAVKEVKAGRVEFRVDKSGIIHTIVGKMSFSDDKILDNINTIITQLKKMKPAAVKGTYLKKITLSSTMGPGIHIDKSTVAKS